jgi:Cupredoxin-like domain
MPRRSLIKSIITTTAVTLALSAPSFAAGTAPTEIRFENNQFNPPMLTVPAGQPLSIKIINASNETIEFESFKLNREKAISPGESIIVGLPALSNGRYDFYDDFHQDVAQGSIVAQ